jgi:hypothetical protein
MMLVEVGGGASACLLSLSCLLSLEFRRRLVLQISNHLLSGCLFSPLSFSPRQANHQIPF